MKMHLFPLQMPRVHVHAVAHTGEPREPRGVLFGVVKQHQPRRRQWSSLSGRLEMLTLELLGRDAVVGRLVQLGWEEVVGKELAWVRLRTLRVGSNLMVDIG